MGIGFGIEVGQSLKIKGMVFTPFYWNGAQSQQRIQFKLQLYQQLLQISILLHNSKPEFENMSPKRLRIQMNSFHVNISVLSCQNMGLGTIVKG